MTTTGTGLCSTSLEPAYRSPSKCSWHRAPGFFTQEIVVFTRRPTAGQNLPQRKLKMAFKWSRTASFLRLFSLMVLNQWNIRRTWRTEDGETSETIFYAITMSNVFEHCLSLQWVHHSVMHTLSGSQRLQWVVLSLWPWMFFLQRGLPRITTKSIPIMFHVHCLNSACFLIFFLFFIPKTAQLPKTSLILVLSIVICHAVRCVYLWVSYKPKH